MSIKSLNQKGVSAVEGLLVVLIVAVIAGTGYYVYTANKNANDTYKSANNSGTPNYSSKKKTESTPSSTQQYLAITEWSVRVPMPSTLDVSDLYYVIKTDNQIASGQEAVLGSSKVKAVSSSCDPGNSSGSTPFGGIERMTASDYQKASKDSANSGVTNGVQLGDYYYVWQVARANCNGGTGDSSVEQVKASVKFPADMPALLEKIENAPQS